MLKLSSVKVSPSISIKSVLKKLDLTGAKYLLVVSAKNKLLGTISDGDIRRALLKSINLDSKITNLFNKSPTYIDSENINHSKIKKNLKKLQISYLPILDRDFKLVDIYLENDSKSIKRKKHLKNCRGIIMAGGFGSRMKPFTNLLPKPLIPINGAPIIDHIIDSFASSGIRNILISVFYKASIIKAYLSESDHSNSIEFLEEEKPLGTAGSLGLIQSKNNEVFVISNCDLIIDLDISALIDFHKKNNFMMTIVTSVHNFQIPYGSCTVDENGCLDEIDEKPSYHHLINTGFYVINGGVLGHIPKSKKVDMDELIKTLQDKKIRIGIYPVAEEKWIDVGQWKEYNKALSKAGLEDTYEY